MAVFCNRGPESASNGIVSVRAPRFALLCVALSLVPAMAQTRHQAAARASASLDEVARQPKSRAVAVNVEQRESHEPERAVRRRNTARLGTLGSRTPEVALEAPATVVPAFTGFQGLGDNFTAIPPDTQGAVGPQHVVTMLNTQVNIQSRNGAPRDNYPITLNAFWSPLGNFSDTFDPRIQYDSTADRWIACAAVNGETSASALLVAVTQTGDPGGTWNYYKVNVGSSNRWGDYPELGFNANWVVVSLNLFQIRGAGSYTGTNLYVFSKADLYQKGTGSHVTFSDAFGEFAPVRDEDDSHPNTLYLVQEFATGFSSISGGGAIRVSKLEGSAGAEKFVGGNVGTVAIPEPWSDTGPNEADFGPQKGTAVKIDTGDSRLDNCVMRNNTIWCAHTVFVPYSAPTRAAAQWFQIDPTGAAPTLVQRGRIDDPTNANFYAYPTIAVNRDNVALIGYTRFSANDYASAGFAFRLPTDPLNAMQPGILLKAGEAPYISPGAHSGANRWGDYSATVVDPANDLDFWTLQEYAATPPSNRTGAFAVWWARVTSPSSSQDCTYSLTPDYRHLPRQRWQRNRDGRYTGGLRVASSQQHQLGSRSRAATPATVRARCNTMSTRLPRVPDSAPAA